MKYSIQEIAKIVGGSCVGEGNGSVDGVVIDSRGAVLGKLFVAIKGEKFDGHDFVLAAGRKGAAATLVSTPNESIDGPQIVVDDTLVAFSALAAYHRNQFSNKVAAITGSAGKTTTRALLSTILRVSQKVHEPEKNFNNHIGVPLTVLKLTNQFDAAVFELGCSDFNEIGPLTQIVRPDVAVITNVGRAHLEKLGDLHGVAKAKGELFENLEPNACAVVNLDDPYISKMPVLAKRMITFSTDKEADVRLLKRSPGRTNQLLTMKLYGEIVDIPFSLPGPFNAVDATAAAAAALMMGSSVSDVQKGLENAAARPGRFYIIDKNNVSIIDDTYNANPSSMAASLSVLKEMVTPLHRIAVLGDMLELGEMASSAHVELGKLAAQLNLKKLFVIGAFANDVKKGAIEAKMSPQNIICGLAHEEIAQKLVEISDSGDALLIKGSRGMKLEKVVAAILEGF